MKVPRAWQVRVATIAAVLMVVMALLSMDSITHAISYLTLLPKPREQTSLVDEMYSKPRFLLTASNSSNHTYLTMLNELLATECADLECASRAFDARRAKVEHTPFIGYIGGAGIAFALCALHFVASTLCKQTMANGGIPPRAKLSGEHPAFHNVEVMLALVEGKGGVMEEQARTRLKSQLSININRPWYDEPRPEFVFGGVPGQEEETVLAAGHLKTHQDWLGGKPFPNGEKRTDSPLHMSFALWSWFLGLTGSNWWCFLMKVIQGVLIPVGAQLGAKLIGVLEDGQPDGMVAQFARFVGGTRAAMVLLYVSLVLVAQFAGSACQWSFDIDVPYAGPMRELKLRLIKKFMSVKGSEEQNWPAGRCSYIIQEDVPTLMSSWDTLFSIVKDMATIMTTIIITALNSSRFQMAVRCLPMILLSVSYAAIDLSNRIEQIDDLVERRRMWLAAESAMLSREIEHQRHVSKAEKRQDATLAAAKATKTSTFDRAVFCVSFVAWYRIAHAYFVTAHAHAMCACFNKVLLYLVVLVDAYGVIGGRKTLAEFTADVFLANVFVSVVSSLHGHFIALLKATPSIHIVAEVLNLGEVFEEDEEDFSYEEEEDLLG